MEEARHWVWAKPKHGLVSTTSDDLHVPINKASSYDDSSWEEQAFAEDASGPLGGCIWPPRSYSCSFCRREFRSAQALGGHMNVHRRDRARLKQYPPDLHREILLQSHHHDNNNNNNIPAHESINPLITSFSPTKYPSQVCALVYNPNPNSDPHHDPTNFIVSPSSPPPYKQSCHEKQVLSIPSCYSSSLLQENKKKRSSGSISPSSHQSWSNLATDRYNHSLNQKNQVGDIKKISSITHLESSGSSCRPKADEYYVKTHDLSVSLNLVVCQYSCPTLSGGKEEEEEEEEEETTFSFKRRRTNPVDSHNIDPLAKSTEGFEISPCSIEDLDLELRLGGRPYKVN